MGHKIFIQRYIIKINTITPSYFTHQIFEKCILGLLEGLSSCCWTFQFLDMLTLCMNYNVSLLSDILCRCGIENLSFKTERNKEKN